MARVPFFERQMAVYAAFHRDRRNRLTHAVGIPVIIFSLLVALSLARWQVAGVTVTAAHGVAAAAVVLWWALDVGIGILLTVLLLPVLLAAEAVARDAPAGAAWWVFGGAFTGGWALQLLGHRFEGRRPAFLGNVFQILVAPMYMAAELLFALGLRRRLAARIESCRRDASPDAAP